MQVPAFKLPACSRVTGKPEAIPGQKSACRKFHHIGNDKRACVAQCEQLPVNRQGLSRWRGGRYAWGEVKVGLRINVVSQLEATYDWPRW
jgi:hypothetical protein